MKALFHLLIHHTRYFIEAHFLVVWLLILALIVLCGVVVGRNLKSKQNPSSSITELSRPLSLLDAFSGILFIAFSWLYIFLIFYKEDFAYYDDDMLTDYSVRGANLPPPLWPGSGRFYPLADQEFNLLKHFTRSPVGYHLLVAAELIILLAVLFFVLKKFALHHRFVIMGAILIVPSFVIPFSGFVYPERNVIFWLAILVLCLQEYSKKNALVYFVGSLVATHFALYYKETVVLFVVGYSVARIFLEISEVLRDGKRSSFVTLLKENVLPLGMLIVASIYVALFVIALFPRKSFAYVATHEAPLSAVVLMYLRIDWLLVVLFLVLAYRIARFLIADGQLDRLWDPLAIGAIAYFLGVISVKLYSAYYLAPVDFIAILYLSWLALGWLTTPSRVRKFAVATASICILFQSAVFSTARIIERKGVITGKNEVARFLNHYLIVDGNKSVELYFPYTDGYRLMELSSYLKYKGFHVVEENGGHQSGPAIDVESPQHFDGNLCIAYKDYSCIQAQTPAPGALIIALPDDDASISQLNEVSKGSVEIFTEKNCSFCDREIRWFQLLHPVLITAPQSKLPDRWLQVEVYKKPA